MCQHDPVGADRAEQIAATMQVEDHPVLLRLGSADPLGRHTINADTLGLDVIIQWEAGHDSFVGQAVVVGGLPDLCRPDPNHFQYSIQFFAGGHESPPEAGSKWRE